MLNSLQIENFKSFDNENIELKKINLLTGKNSSGKSSFIQALLLLVHNVDKKELIQKGNVSPIVSHRVSIGAFNEIRNLNKNATAIFIGAKSKQEAVNIKISNTEDNLLVEFINESDILQDVFQSENRKIHYLSANRIGAQDLYSENINNFDNFGFLGEFAIDYYEKHSQDKLPEYLVKDSSFKTLKGQVNYWLSYILDCNISTEKISKSDKIRTTFNLTSTKTTPLSVRPKNIGSGISYIISILIMCLSSQKDDILIIENPEIHLHPKAQSLLTEFFVFIANAGIQLIIETHSDHIFNGARKAICKNKISKDDVAVNFFSLKEENFCTEYTKIEFNEQGKILNFPKGLFDQFDEDLNALLGLD